jgi:hypothetical protein
MRYLLGTFDSPHILSDTPLSCINLDSFVAFLFSFISSLYPSILCIFIILGFFSTFLFHGRVLFYKFPIYLSFNHC